jgi:hypothetical protein
MAFDLSKLRYLSLLGSTDEKLAAAFLLPPKQLKKKKYRTLPQIPDETEVPKEQQKAAALASVMAGYNS